MSAQDIYTNIIDSPILTYPPVNPISDKVDTEKMGRILKDLNQKPVDPRKGILYLHIPYCKSRCIYCTYNSIIIKVGDPHIQSYLDAAKREIDQYKDKEYIKYLDFEAVFLGGGSPSMLTEAQLEDVFETMHQSFNLKNIKEFTIEFELRTVTEEKVKLCREYGVTRISFGWQTFAPHVRKICSLMPTEEMLQEKIDLLKKYNYSVNADLIYGLPNQTFDDWKNDISTALAYGFTGVDLYKCENVPPSTMFKLHKKRDWTFASKEEMRDMFQYAMHTLKSKGFIQDSYQHLYNPEQSTSALLYNNYLMLSSHDVMALGPSSYGLLDHWVYKNNWGINEYISEERDPEKLTSIECAVKLNAEDLVERDLVQGLSRALRISKDLLKVPLADYQKEVMQKLKEHSLIEETEHEYIITNNAEGYVFNIARDFMSSKNKKKALSFFMQHRASRKKIS